MELGLNAMQGPFFADGTATGGTSQARSVAQLWHLWWRVGAALLSALFATGLIWVERSRQRHDLCTLNAHLLKDIGVTREQALREAHRPFWIGNTWSYPLLDAIWGQR
jgi:uncharacterized protein YjiS (DUF1127 family)